MKNTKEIHASDKRFSFITKSITVCVIEMKNGVRRETGNVRGAIFTAISARSYGRVPFLKSNVATFISPRLPRANRSSRGYYARDRCRLGGDRVFRPSIREDTPIPSSHVIESMPKYSPE